MGAFVLTMIASSLLINHAECCSAGAAFLVSFDSGHTEGRGTNKNIAIDENSGYIYAMTWKPGIIKLD